ncbi:hypothetical protein KUF71_015082 [Frankliniella fusca]|uniref:Uncharacterized protein n=1 Tax=Frankliniella fusca TaxID=407009 RepID=A0AAE1HTV7_9NEOP|nr:hypothetical protein KUF71_015082 [Frankliniella fusca]
MAPSRPTPTWANGGLDATRRPPSSIRDGRGVVMVIQSCSTRHTMRVIVTVLALAAVASADMVSKKEQIVTVYGVPKTLSEYYLQQEKTGLKGLFYEPMILAERNPTKTDFSTVFFNEGLQSFYKYKELEGPKTEFIEGPEVALLYLSAARLLELPELSLPTYGIVAVPEKYHGNLYQRYAGNVPTLVCIDASRLKEFKNVDKLMQIGQFKFTFENAQILSDIVPVTEGPLTLLPFPQQASPMTEDKPILYEKTEMMPPLQDSEVLFAPVKPIQT